MTKNYIYLLGVTLKLGLVECSGPGCYDSEHIYDENYTEEGCISWNEQTGYTDMQKYNDNNCRNRKVGEQPWCCEKEGCSTWGYKYEKDR